MNEPTQEQKNRMTLKQSGDGSLFGTDVCFVNQRTVPLIDRPPD